MTIADFARELKPHEFSDLLHFNRTQPGNMSQARAKQIIEGAGMLNRVLTAEEQTWLTSLINKLAAGDIVDRDMEGAHRLLRDELITDAEFETLLGIS